MLDGHYTVGTCHTVRTQPPPLEVVERLPDLRGKVSTAGDLVCDRGEAGEAGRRGGGDDGDDGGDGEKEYEVDGE